MRDLGRLFPATNETMGGEVMPFWRAPRGPQRMITGALVLQGIMLVLLLAVCGNSANLMLARASTRQREVGMRLALGAAVRDRRPAADRERDPLRGRRRAGRGGRRLGHQRAARGADDRVRSRSAFRPTSIWSASRSP